MKKTGKKLRLLKGEKAMYAVILITALLIPVLNIYTSSVLTRSNIELEEVKADIEMQNSENESLSMQIDELASLENIQSVAKDRGLSYNNTNILVIK